MNKKEGLIGLPHKHKFFAYYNHKRMGHKDFFYKIHVTVNENFKADNPYIKLEEFKDGYYTVMKSKYKYNGWTWGEFINWISKSKEYLFDNYWFFEEYKLKSPELEMDTEIVLYMPVIQN